MKGQTTTCVPAPAEGREPGAQDLLGSRYRLDRVLGQGGMGRVVRALDLSRGEFVAIKFLAPKRALDPDSVRRFLQEARATLSIDSPHVVKVLDASQGALGEPPYIVMEYLTGHDLSDELSEGHRIAVSTAVDWVLQAAQGIAEAHALGIVHRDIKPSNLWLTEDGYGRRLIKVLDFGISKAPGGTETRITETDAVFGSPAYMSPEQLRSTKNVDARTDLWSLGVVLYELLTGVLPFEGDTAAALLAAVAADAPRRLRPERPEIPSGLEEAVLSCLVKDRRARVQSVSELATALAPFASATGKVTAANIVGVVGAPPESDAFPLRPSCMVFATTTEVDGPRRAGRGRLWALILGPGAALSAAFLLLAFTSAGRTREAPTHLSRAAQPGLEIPQRAAPLHVNPGADTGQAAPAAAPVRVDVEGTPKAGPKPRRWRRLPGTARSERRAPTSPPPVPNPVTSKVQHGTRKLDLDSRY